MADKSEGEPSVGVELPVGSRVTLMENISTDEGGSMADILYEGTVERHVPATGLLRMSDGTGRAEFLDMLREADGFEVLREYDE